MQLPQNTYDAKIVLGHFNAKIGREDRIIDIRGKHKSHESTSKNGNTVVSFGQIDDLIIVSTKFHCKKIHTATGDILGTNDVNQTDHVLVNRRRMHTVTDV